MTSKSLTQERVDQDIPKNHNMSTAIHDKDQWSANAATYAQGNKSIQLSNAPTEALFTQLNVAYPFSNASAILDVGSGPGVTIGKLIETYGSQLPGDARLQVPQ